MTEFSQMSPSDLLTLHAEVAEELRTRGITRSSNNPTGDLGEYLFCKAFGWTRLGNANAGIDAVCKDGTKYQIKARRITRHNNSRQLSALRELDGVNFDYLAGVLFSETYTVIKAAIIPHAIVLQRASFVSRTNSHRFLLHDDVWKAQGVQDVTAALAAIKL